MDWLTQGRGELFKDEGQDAKRQFGEMEAWLSAQTDVKGRGDAAGVDALQQDLDLVVGQSQKWWLGSNQAQQRMQGETWGAAWDKDTEGRGIQESTCFMWQILSSFQVVFLLCIHQNRLCSAAEQWSPNVSHTHTHTRTHSSQPTNVCGQWGSCTCTIWNMQLLGQEKKRD